MNSKSTQPDRSFNRAALCYSIVIAALTCLGCADSSQQSRVPVAGSITLDGQPVNMVTVMFEPVDADEATRTRAEVVDGKFELAKRDGPCTGPYAVTLCPVEPDSEEAMGPGGKKVRNFLASYNQLRRAIRRHGPIDVQMLSGIDNVVTVELKSR